jgi:hypothetical protein
MGLKVRKKMNKFEEINGNMGTTELRSNLHKMVDSIEDVRLLRAIYAFLNAREHAENGKMWSSLTEEQKSEVLGAYDESDDDSNLISDDDVWKDVKQEYFTG